MSYKSEHIVNITKFLALEDAVEQHKFHYVCLGRFNTMVLYEPNDNVLFEIAPLAKWFQKYTDKKVKIDISVTFDDFPDSVMKQVINDNFEYINNRYLKNKLPLIKEFGDMSKTDIYKKIKNWEMDNTFLSFNNNEKFLKLINKLSRKEKIAKLLS